MAELVIGGLKYAQSVGASTASISCNKNAEISKYTNLNVEVETGAEILTGSTRLKLVQHKISAEYDFNSFDDWCRKSI